MTQALNGLQVVDLSNTSAGAQASMFLADYGADVVHVEPPGGSPLRAIAGFPVWGRGKQSIELNLKDAADVDVVRGLATGADVVIETMRPGVADRLGVGHDALATVNPRLVYTSITGFGRRGPYAAVKGYEGIVMATSGGFYRLSALTDRPGPAFISTPFCAFSAAQTAVQGTLAALIERERSGLGQHVETSLMQALTTHSTYGWYMTLVTDRYPDAFPAAPVFDENGVPNASLYFRLMVALTADGRWLQFSQTMPRLYQAYVRAIGLDWMFDDPDWNTLPDFTTSEQRNQYWEYALTAVRQRTYAEWVELFDREPDVWAEVFRQGLQLLDHPQLQWDKQVVTIDDAERGPVRQPGSLVRMGGTPAVLGKSAPRRDEHGITVRERAATATARAAVAAANAVAGADLLPAGDQPAGLPLAGVTILELGTFFAGPFGSTMLTDLGARVFKIESLEGEPMRTFLPFPEVGAAKVMQGKQSIALDINAPEAIDIIHELARRSDIVLQTFRAGVAERLGVDAASLHALNPDLVYHSAPGYGIDGPCGHRPAFAPTIGAGSGIGWRNTGRGVPERADLTLAEVKAYSRRLQSSVSVDFAQSDGLAALGVASALLLGLYARERGAGGQSMMTTMMSTAAHALSDDMVDFAGRPPLPPVDEELNGTGPLYRLYQTSDGWVFLAAPTPREWAPLLAALPAGHRLDSDDRFATEPGRVANADALAETLAEIFRTRPATDWEHDLLAGDVACVKVEEDTTEHRLMSDAFGRASGYLAEIDHPTFGAHSRLAPVIRFSRSGTQALSAELLGDSTDAVLAELGYPPARIADLRARSIVG